VEPEEATQYSTEFLNSLEPTGLPPHTRTLKTGCPVMLLRNIDPPKLCIGTRLIIKQMLTKPPFDPNRTSKTPKLCNGTRLIIKHMNNNVIETTILTEQAKGQEVFLPSQGPLF
jgi:hypothetical protein